LASSGSNVLVIESDLRKPSAKDYLKIIATKHTLTSLLSESAKMPPPSLWKKRGYIHEYRQNCFVLLGGRAGSDPSKLLSTPKFEKLVSDAEKYFDYVLLDCPPILPVADSLTLTKIAARTIVVVHAGKTTKDQFGLLLHSMSQVGVRPVAVILNMVPNIRFSDSYGYKYQSRYSLGNYEKKYGKYRLEDSYGYGYQMQEKATSHIFGKFFKRNPSKTPKDTGSKSEFESLLEEFKTK
jgi:Mrp family chromosome partitioning ATPase